jgi:hypothetical protein
MPAKKHKEPAKRGQPTKYDPELIPIVQALVARGLTNYEIADVLGITEKTMCNWRIRHEEFAVALKRSKELFDAQIEATLIMKANGFTRRVQKATASGKVVTVEEYFPPSDTAIKFWLERRKPELYRDQKDVNVKVGVEEGFLRFLERMDAKAKAERESGALPPLLEHEPIRPILDDSAPELEGIVLVDEVIEIEPIRPDGVSGLIEDEVIEIVEDQPEDEGDR